MTDTSRDTPSVLIFPPLIPRGRSQDHPRWLEARVEGEVPKSENLVVEMGGGVRVLVGNRAQAALAGELLRAMGLGRGC